MQSLKSDPGRALGQDYEIRPNLKICLRVWWSIAWRAMLIGSVAGGVMTQLVHYINSNDETIKLTLLLIGAVFSFFLEVWLIKDLLSRNFGTFRIAVLNKEDHRQD